jgi:hypothetical protein
LDCFDVVCFLFFLVFNYIPEAHLSPFPSLKPNYMKTHLILFTQSSAIYRLAMKCAAVLVLLLTGTSVVVFGQVASDAGRGITLEEYTKAKTFTFKNIEEDTYAKFENMYILDRYQMKPPYVFKYSDGIERRFYLYKMLDNKTKKELGMVAVYYLPAQKKAVNLCIPNAAASKEVWAMYIDDLKDLGAKESGLLSTYSYVLSREVSALSGSGNGQAVSVAGTATDYDVCFPENARVMLPDGSERLIGEVKAGDQIAAYDLESGKLVQTVVEEVQVHEEKAYSLTSVMLFKEELTASAFIGGLSVNYHMEATANHPVLTDKGRKTMKELTAGDNLYVYDGITGNVTVLKAMQVTHDIRTTSKVYNLVTSKKNYLVNRAVVLDK